MKNTIVGFNQNKLIEYGLGLIEAMILRYLVDFISSGKMISIVAHGKTYYWVSYKHLKEDLPILGINDNDALRRRFKKLEKAGILIHYHSKEGGSFSYYNLGENYNDLINIEEEESVFSEAPSKLKSGEVVIENSTPTDKTQEQNNLSTKDNNIYSANDVKELVTVYPNRKEKAQKRLDLFLGGKKLKINKNLRVVIRSIIITLIFILVLNILLTLGRRLNMDILSNAVVVNTLLEMTVLMAQVFVLKITLKRKVSLEDLSLRADNRVVKNMCIGALLTALYMISVLAGNCIIKYLHFEGFGFGLFPSNEVIMSIFNAFMLAIFAAVCEEVFFRGILCNYLNRYKGNLFGVVISSMIFSAFHVMRSTDIKNFIFIFFIGIILGYCFLKTKSLYLSISIHFMVDFISFCIGLDTVNFLAFKQSENITLAQLDTANFIIEIIMYFVFIGVYKVISGVKRKDIVAKQESKL